MKKPTLTRLIEFQKMLLAFQDIDRVVHYKKGTDYRLENDAEHTYNLAITAWFLAESFEHLDRDEVIRLALVHDLVELHAGDTYAFASQEHLDSKKDREKVAWEKLVSDWPDFPEMTAAIDRYEKKDSPEACFVYALDKVMPMLTIYLNQGQTWHLKDISREQQHSNKLPKVTMSSEIEYYYNQINDLLIRSEHLFPSR